MRSICEVNSATISMAAHCLRGCCSFLSAGIVFSVYHIIESIAIGKACILTKKALKTPLDRLNICKNRLEQVRKSKNNLADKCNDGIHGAQKSSLALGARCGEMI